MHKRQTTPAILGGKSKFAVKQDIVKPWLPELSTLSNSIDKILRSGKLTNNSEYVRCFEQEVEHYLDTHVAIVANATLGLMLLLRALKLKGEVILPSFTYIATAQAVIWNNLRPVFVDCERETFTIDPQKAEEAITPSTSAIIAVNVFGNMPQVERLEKLARKKIKLIFDSAQGFGASYGGKKSGNFGEGEAFSFHATKNLATGEGGAVTSTNRLLIDEIKKTRNFGLEPGGDYFSLGLNAKMMEFSAILGLACLKNLDKQISSREKAYFVFKERLSKIPGINFQHFTKKAKSNFQNLVIVIEEDKFGLNRDELHTALDADNIMSKRYFYPALHHMSFFKKYAKFKVKDLRNTEYLCQRTLCLPLYPFMKEEMISKICQAIESIHLHSPDIKRHLRKRDK